MEVFGTTSTLERFGLNPLDTKVWGVGRELISKNPRVLREAALLHAPRQRGAGTAKLYYLSSRAQPNSRNILLSRLRVVPALTTGVATDS